jgi:flagellar biosynthetic protein FliQ
MSLGDVSAMMRGGIIEVIFLAAPLLVSALVVGLIVAIFQATTSIQEQTLTFVPKVLTILIILALLGSWMFSHLGQYTIRLFQMIPQMAN